MKFEVQDNSIMGFHIFSARMANLITTEKANKENINRANKNSKTNKNNDEDFIMRVG